jgi:hypothetical protein
MPDGSWTWEQTTSARKGGDGIRLGIIPKVEPAELLKVPASKGKRESRRRAFLAVCLGRYDRRPTCCA